MMINLWSKYCTKWMTRNTAGASLGRRMIALTRNEESQIFVKKLAMKDEDEETLFD